MPLGDIGNSPKIVQETIETIHVQANRTITAVNNTNPDFYSRRSNAHHRDIPLNHRYRQSHAPPVTAARRTIGARRDRQTVRAT